MNPPSSIKLHRFTIYENPHSQSEDAWFGEELRGDELPGELRRRRDRLAAIQAAKGHLEQPQSNFTDSESRIMKTSAEGFQQYCNAQLAVESSH